MAVKVNQVYSEIGGKKRYLRVDELSGDDAVCTAGWLGRGTQILWSHRAPVLPQAVLLNTSLYRLEQDVDE
jgi:hypothetical protein